ncbi:MAG TPA: UDP-N-acetylmuramate--L-alanine ligase [Acidimicrobiales bacterium]|nr:UDP-N-acetylmuramate--L-alanine ligase [Acidimicrobiales bacterium]
MTAPATVIAPVDLRVPGRYHVVGVGGPGMSAIALVLAGMGHRVSGSDLRALPVLDRLRAAGVDVHVGHSRDLVAGVDAVTASSAIPDRNIELAAARSNGTPVLRRGEMLAAVCACARAAAVVGTHGKTTTASMVTMILAQAGWRPSFLVGGDLNDVGTGAQWTGGEWLVVEADESDGTHLDLPVEATVLTNVEADHLDFYGSFASVVDGFSEYLAGVTGPRVVCGDDAVAAELAARHDAITYGLDPGADYVAADIRRDNGVLHFAIDHAGRRLGEIRLPLRGVHNVRNATGAVALALTIGAPFEAAQQALARFGGVARRFDVRGRHRGITLIDDYAHLPSEIAAVLEAAATSGDDWRRIVAVFQPNRYQRMAVLSPEYRDAFVRADVTVITDIYPSGEAPLPGVTGKLVVDAVCDAHPEQRVVWMPKRSELVAFLSRELRSGDVSISMGCGDVAMLPDEVLVALRARERGELE